ncbi:MAG: S-layer homology domain-containing protein [Eubacteriales bacterium]|nr:S-layer homology domain-containing protein [Eubacteriales bacterium]
MKRKLLCAFVLGLICTILAVGASAADISANLNTPTSNRNTGNIVVSGETGSGNSEYVFIIITDSSKTAADMTESGILTDAYTVGQCMTDDTGNFSATLKLAEQYGDGSYNCIVYTASGNSGTIPFTYQSPYTIPKALKYLSERKLDTEVAGDEALFLAKFESVKTLFGTDTTAYYDSFVQTEKERLVNIMIQIRKEGGYDSVISFNKDFAMAEYLIAIDKLTTEDDVYAFLETDAAKAALQLDTRYADAAEAVKRQVAAVIAGESFVLPADLHNLIKEKLVIAEFGAITVWNDLLTLVGKYSDTIVIDSDSQTKLGNITVDDACQKMYSYTSEMTTVAGIIGAYKKGIADAYNEKYPNGAPSGDNNGNGGNNGGNGGGGGGGGAAPAPSDDNLVVVPIVDNTKPKEERERFSDLAGYSWAKEAIYKLAENGIITGYPDGRFGPGDTLTREQVVVMLVNAFQKATDGDVSGFADVKSGAWYYDSIRYAVGSGMVAGMGDGRFGVGLPITRQDFAVMAYNAIGASYEPNGTANMKDMDSVAGYAQKAVKALVELGVISGDDEGNVRPLAYTTRAEAAVILSKLK